MSKKEFWKGKTNDQKIIIELCGGTGSWGKPYKDAGYNVINITHPHHDVFDYEIPKEQLKFVYGILAAPTCTMFSLARTTAKTPRDLKGGFKLVQKCLDIIHDCLADGNLIFWALENPMGYLRQMLGKRPLTFNPCDYGDGWTKKTDLWGYYNIPKQKKVELTEQQARDCSINSRVLPKLPEDYVLPDNFKSQQARRSMTPPGFANQFFKANK